MSGKRKRGIGTSDLSVASTALATLLLLISVSFPLPALALSELKPVQSQATDVEQGPSLPPLDEPTTGPDGGLPEPGPVIRDTLDAPDGADIPPPIITEDDSLEIITDLGQLPEPVLRMRQLILEAAATGDPERLRPLLGTGPNATQLALTDIDADAVEYLRSISGDGEGQEILAILMDLLSAGLVHADPGGPNDTYIWPYFVALPLEALTAPQMVDLLRLVTAGDVEDMKAYGAYNFYRVGISPDGEWRFFMAGD